MRIGRPRKGLIFFLIAALVFSGLAYLARDPARPAFYQEWTLKLFGWIPDLGQRIWRPVGDTTHRLAGLWDAQHRLEALAAEREALVNRLRVLEAENRALASQLGQFDRADLGLEQAVPARVLSFDPLQASQVMTLNVGAREGIRVDQAVIAGGHLIGRILAVHSDYSRVLLITDPKSAVDVVDMASQARGTLVGLKKTLGLNRDRFLTQAEHLSGHEEVRFGDLLQSSGRDGVYPAGWTVGRIQTLHKDPTGLFFRAEVEPLVELSKVSEVLVLR
ncbi:MAG: rod shape-determining protein MreC [Candidatus Binatia bacterium]